MVLDASLFEDVADALGIAHPAIVEKDYYGVQLLKLLADLELPDYTFVFAGGTCLTKAHKNTYRMSEDIDIKFIPNIETLKKSRSAQRRCRREMNQQIVDAISSSKILNLVTKSYNRNEHKFQQLLLQYPTIHKGIEALRSHIQLELTESILLQQPCNVSLSSLFANVTGQESEVNVFPCIELESIAAEKFVALLRRTAAIARDNENKDDPTLIRHIYDLYFIREAKIDLEKTKSLVKQVIEIDVDQFGNQQAEFCENPVGELLFGFDTLKQNSNSNQRYTNFIGPLVYHPNPVSWQTVLHSFEELVQYILEVGTEYR